MLTFDVESVDPVLVTAGGPDRLTVTGTLTNAGPEPVTELIYRFQRGGALSNEADVRQRLAEPSEPNDVARRTTSRRCSRPSHPASPCRSPRACR